MHHEFPEAEAAWTKADTTWGRSTIDVMSCFFNLRRKYCSCKDTAANKVMLMMLIHNTGITNGLTWWAPGLLRSRGVLVEVVLFLKTVV